VQAATLRAGHLVVSFNRWYRKHTDDQNGVCEISLPAIPSPFSRSIPARTRLGSVCHLPASCPAVEHALRMSATSIQRPAFPTVKGTVAARAGHQPATRAADYRELDDRAFVGRSGPPLPVFVEGTHRAPLGGRLAALAAVHCLTWLGTRRPPIDEAASSLCSRARCGILVSAAASTPDSGPADRLPPSRRCPDGDHRILRVNRASGPGLGSAKTGERWRWDCTPGVTDRQRWSPI